MLISTNHANYQGPGPTPCAIRCPAVSSQGSSGFFPLWNRCWIWRWPRASALKNRCCGFARTAAKSTTTPTPAASSAPSGAATSTMSGPGVPASGRTAESGSARYRLKTALPSPLFTYRRPVSPPWKTPVTSQSWARRYNALDLAPGKVVRPGIPRHPVKKLQLKSPQNNCGKCRNVVE